MAADVVNLNKARKAKARADKAAQAGINRVKFGRSKAEREHDEAEEARRLREIDGALRGPNTTEPGDGRDGTT